MNKPAIKCHLKEATEQLAATLRAIKKKGYREEALLVELSHVYHHVNFAWHGRNYGAARHRECSDADFYRWPRFPSEKEMLLDRLPAKKKKPNQHLRATPLRVTPAGSAFELLRRDKPASEVLRRNKSVFELLRRDKYAPAAPASGVAHL